MIDKIEIRRSKDKKGWELIIFDAKGKEHKIPQVYPNWQTAGNQIPYVRPVIGGWKVRIPETDRN